VFVKRQGKQKAKQSTIGDFFGSKPKVTSKAKQEPSELPVSSETLTPTDVSYNIGKEIDNEGRTIVLEFPFATIANVYVPNAGQDLKRLSYRTEEWDKDFFGFMQGKQADRKLPVIWLGDLNIAHTALDIWNDGAKHLAKQAGVTPEERASFQAQLDSGFVDAFRKLHPSAKGHYSYWSQRAGNREPNKGLRLDYFICSPDLFSEDSKAVVRDSYMLKDQGGSDHGPVVLELEIKG
jgi:exodeoxyribonuclease III